MRLVSFQTSKCLWHFFSNTFIWILFNTISLQPDIFIFHWCCNLLYIFVHWYIFYSIIQDDLSVLWASPRSFCRNCFSSYYYSKFPPLFSSLNNFNRLCARNFVPTLTCSAWNSDVCLYFYFYNVSYFLKYLTFKYFFKLFIMGVNGKKDTFFQCTFFVL